MEGSRQRVAEDLSALIEQESLPGVENRAKGSLPGFLLQRGGAVEGHRDDLTLQG